MARENEKVSTHGALDRHLTFMAFKRAEASSALWPPDRKATPGTAAGTARSSQDTVASEPQRPSSRGFICSSLSGSLSKGLSMRYNIPRHW